MGFSKSSFKTILGLDPGKDKIGWALINSNKELLLSGICNICNISDFLEIFFLDSPKKLLKYLLKDSLDHKCGIKERWNIKSSPWIKEVRISQEIFSKIFSHEMSMPFIVVGNGTGSCELIEKVKKIKRIKQQNIEIIIVNESGTTLEARELYWSLHAPVWWQKCLPRTLWYPPRFLDDFAAWAIARRSFIEKFCLQRINF